MDEKEDDKRKGTGAKREKEAELVLEIPEAYSER